MLAGLSMEKLAQQLVKTASYVNRFQSRAVGHRTQRVMNRKGC